MVFEIILIGEGITEDEFSGYDDISISDNIAIVSFKNATSQHIFHQNILKQGKYEVFTFQDFEEIIRKKASEYEDYENLTFEDLIKWQFEGAENFILHNDNMLSNWEINYDTIQKLSDVPLLGSIQMSNTGIFLANVHSKKLLLHVEKLNKIFINFDFEDDIDSLLFNSKDEHVLVYTRNKTYLFDIFEGKIIEVFDHTNLLFDMSGENVFRIGSDMKFNINTLSYIKYEEEFKPRIMKTKYRQTMAFSNEKVQKIFYFNENGFQKKTLANVSNVQFFFSKNRGYALITKSIKGGKSYALESYSDTIITINIIENEILKIEVSDNGFITYDVKKNVNMYKLDKYTFRMIKQVRKEDDVVISISDNMYCVYDGENESIEFYDDVKLRSVYSHQACTNIFWSESGLYCASISKSTGNVQLYNVNGKMFWKKVYNRITSFMWRPYFPLNKEEKKNIDQYDLKNFEKPFETSVESSSNLQELISEWKSFIIEKRQLLTKLN